MELSYKYYYTFYVFGAGNIILGLKHYIFVDAITLYLQKIRYLFIFPHNKKAGIPCGLPALKITIKIINA